MSWGCSRHEMDQGSEAWKAANGHLFRELYETGKVKFGRQGEVCPLCFKELRLRHLALVDICERIMKKGPGNLDGLLYTLRIRLSMEPKP